MDPCPPTGQWVQKGLDNGSNRAFQGNVAIGVTQPDGQLWNQAMQVTSPDDQILNQFHDGATCISSKFGHQMAPHSLVVNLATRWHHLH